MEEKTAPISREREHLYWVDVMRLVAIFLVVCCHCCDPFNCSTEARTNVDYQWWGSLYGSCLRPCVPLFAMMTGLLVLPIRGMSAGTFYRKRVLRVLFPFLIWSVLYNLFPWVVGLCGGGEKLVVTFFPYAGYGTTPSLTLGSALRQIALIPFHFSTYAVHMWYIYMLIGLYLFMPVLSAWMERCGRNEMRTFLLLWGVTLFFPYVYQYVSKYFWGTCSWNAFGMLYYFAGFNGYLIMGHYLKNYNRMGWGRTLLLALPLLAIGYAVTLTGFRSMTGNPQSTEEMIELFWTYCSPNVVMLTLACFVVLQKVKVNSERMKGWLRKVSVYGLGIYMCHYFFVGVGFSFVHWLGVPLGLQIPVASVLVMTLAWTLTATVFHLLPRQAKWIMG
jgi:surface polysaccharide O-acyltransferase-like enzyme